MNASEPTPVGRAKSRTLATSDLTRTRIPAELTEQIRVTSAASCGNAKGMGQTIGGLLRAEQIDLNLKAEDATSAICAVATRLAKNHAVLDLDLLCKEIIAREQLSSTALTHGIAVPHARTKAVGEIVLAIGRSSEPILFGSEKKPVQLVFVIGTPHDQIVSYLSVVGNLARMVKDSAIREVLMETDDVDEFIAALR